MSLPKTQSTWLASAGEHLVLSHLLRRGLIASIAPPNTEHYDIVVTNKVGGRFIPVQVKTATRDSWILSEKNEIAHKGLIYIFIYLSEDNDPEEFYIMPSKKVAEVTKMSYEIWLEMLGQSGVLHKKTSIRVLKRDHAYLKSKVRKHVKFLVNHKTGWLEDYKNNWELVIDLL